MTASLRIAVAKVPITPDPGINGIVIRRQMALAHAANAQLVLFPEGALSGYVKNEISDWTDVDWEHIERETDAIAKIAKELGLWVVFGAAHLGDQNKRPFNSLLVVSDKGELAYRYDKRILSFTEQSDWFVAGAPCKTIEINGVRIGFAICIEIRFPELFAELEAANVDLVLVASYSQDSHDEFLARAQASFYNLFLAFSVPANEPHQDISSLGVGPDGGVLARCEAASHSPVIFDVDPNEPHWNAPLRRARPWRRQTRSFVFQKFWGEQTR